jgi:hypothetical protein
MQIEKQFGEKQFAVKAQRPEDNSIVELPLERIDGIFEKDI